MPLSTLWKDTTQKEIKQLFWLCIEQCHNNTSNVTHYASSGHTKTPQKTITTSRENRQIIGEYLDGEHLLKLMENISMMRLPATTLLGEGNPKTLDNEQHNQTIRSSKQCTKMRFEKQMEKEPHPSESLHRECEFYQQCEFTKSALQNFASSLGHYYAASERIQKIPKIITKLYQILRRVQSYT